MFHFFVDTVSPEPLRNKYLLFRTEVDDLSEMPSKYQSSVCVCCSQGAAEAIQTQQDLPGGERDRGAVVRAADR